MNLLTSEDKFRHENEICCLLHFMFNIFKGFEIELQNNSNPTSYHQKRISVVSCMIVISVPRAGVLTVVIVDVGMGKFSLITLDLF